MKINQKLIDKSQKLIAIGKKNSQLGFTLIENVVIIAIISIISAIAVQNWLVFIDNQRLKNAQDQILQAKREAQNKANRSNQIWQVSIKLVNDIVYWAVHPKSTDPQDANWQKLDENVDLDLNETTLKYTKGIWKVEFNHKGLTNGQLGRVTLNSRNNPSMKRCVFVSTLLGTIRTGQNQPKPKNGKYCY